MQTEPRRGTGLGVTLALSVFAFAVAGFHPYAEDGGVYVAGVEKLLQPQLFPAWTAFVTAHLRFSLFSPMLADVVRVSHVSLPVVLLVVYFAGIWATLHGGWMVVSRCEQNLQGRVGAVALLACWLTLPVAGTSLIVMDPYLTARTISTPLTLMALAWALDRQGRSWICCGLALTAATLVHPLMAGYGLAAVLLVACLGSSHRWLRRWGAWAMLALALAGAGTLQALSNPESADYLRIAITRYYWFPARWHWYEWLGLAGPVVVLIVLERWRRGGSTPPLAAASSPSLVLTRATMALGGIAFAVACYFSREQLSTHLVARMQPLRCFQLVYLTMALLLGAWLGKAVLRGKLWRWAAMLLLLGSVMTFAQRQIYASSAHVEWPGSVPRNAWERAFLWVRDNTPFDAVFALDARYITQGKGEDAQCFRAIAERSALPDYSKDGGVASIFPDLTEAWTVGQTAQTGLEAASDQERAARLKPPGAGWVVLERASATGWLCPYANKQVKVCRVP